MYTYTLRPLKMMFRLKGSGFGGSGSRVQGLGFGI